ncbi:MAG: 50S ribosomal protein L11 methyltransferase [Bacteroidota bacterium]
MHGDDSLEISFSNIPDGFSDILIAELTEIGFDGFREKENALLAYIPETGFEEPAINEIVQKYPELKETFFSVVSMPEKNWNEVWESNYEPVLIAGKCYVRAPFHPSLEAMSHEARDTRHRAKGKGHRAQGSGLQHPASSIEIIIEPKMSFGTAHHETTALMIEWLLEETVDGETVLDMGCGTGVLAILAAKQGAGRVVAIDNNPWAVDNTKENAERNNCTGIDVLLGEVPVFPDLSFDLILANINRNVLLVQIPDYARVLGLGGRLVLSGFFAEDLPAIETCAETNGFRLSGSRTKNNWIAAKFNR